MHVCEPLGEHALLTIFFLSFFLSSFLLCAICKLRNCSRSKMCHSSSWFFAAALSSSLSYSLSTLFIYSFCWASASRASLRNARDLREYRSHVFGFLVFFFYCVNFFFARSHDAHIRRHTHVHRMFSRQSSLEKTTTNKAPRRHWTTTAATTTAMERQRSNRVTIWLFSTLATMKF